MTGRERLRLALSASGCDEMPVLVPYDEIYARDRWQEVTECPWWYRVSPDLEHQLRWRSRTIENLGHDWFHVPLCESRASRQRRRVKVTSRGAALVDDETGEVTDLQPELVIGWQASADASPVRPDRLAQTPAEIDAAVPLPSIEDETGDGRADLARLLLARFGSSLCPCQSSSSPLWYTYYLWGYEGMMEMIATRPDLVACACERYLELVRHGVRQAAALGAEVIFVQEALVDMISPKAFAELDVPYMQRLVAEIRACGMQSIYYYTGNPAGKWDAILAIGADALSFEEGKKGFELDIGEVAAWSDGRCALLGNVDPVAVLQDGSDGCLQREIERQWRAGRRNHGRFALSLGSPVTPATPLRRVQRYTALAHGQRHFGDSA